MFRTPLQKLLLALVFGSFTISSPSAQAATACEDAEADFEAAKGTVEAFLMREAPLPPVPPVLYNCFGKPKYELRFQSQHAEAERFADSFVSEHRIYARRLWTAGMKAISLGCDDDDVVGETDGKIREDLDALLTKLTDDLIAELDRLKKHLADTFTQKPRDLGDHLRAVINTQVAVNGFDTDYNWGTNSELLLGQAGAISLALRDEYFRRLRVEHDMEVTTPTLIKLHNLAVNTGADVGPDTGKALEKLKEDAMKAWTFTVQLRNSVLVKDGQKVQMDYASSALVDLRQQKLNADIFEFGPTAVPLLDIEHAIIYKGAKTSTLIDPLRYEQGLTIELEACASNPHALVYTTNFFPATEKHWVRGGDQEGPIQVGPVGNQVMHSLYFTNAKPGGYEFKMNMTTVNRALVVDQSVPGYLGNPQATSAFSVQITHTPK